MVRRYEMMIILDPNQNDDDLDKQVKKIEDTITSSEGGKIINVDRWGKKRLAYEVAGKQFGYYVVFEFEAEPDLIPEMDRTNRYDSNVVRHMILHIPEKVLKLKQREKELKANLEERRRRMAEEADETPVVDMITSEDEDEGGESEEKAEEPKEKAAADEAKEDAKDEPKVRKADTEKSE